MQLDRAIEMIHRYLEAEARRYCRADEWFYTFDLPRPVWRGGVVHHIGLFTPSWNERHEEWASNFAIAPRLRPFTWEEVERGEIDREEAGRAAQVEGRHDYPCLAALLQDVLSVSRSTFMRDAGDGEWFLGVTVRPTLAALDRLEVAARVQRSGRPELYAEVTTTDTRAVDLATGHVFGSTPAAVVRDWLEENNPAVAAVLLRGRGDLFQGL
jgi:hypothetical protein